MFGVLLMLTRAPSPSQRTYQIRQSAISRRWNSIKPREREQASRASDQRRLNAQARLEATVSWERGSSDRMPIEGQEFVGVCCDETPQGRSEVAGRPAPDAFAFAPSVIHALAGSREAAVRMWALAGPAASMY